jgi:hypothetical protein
MLNVMESVFSQIWKIRKRSNVVEDRGFHPPQISGRASSPHGWYQSIGHPVGVSFISFFYDITKQKQNVRISQLIDEHNVLKKAKIQIKEEFSCSKEIICSLILENIEFKKRNLYQIQICSNLSEKNQTLVITRDSLNEQILKLKKTVDFLSDRSLIVGSFYFVFLIRILFSLFFIVSLFYFIFLFLDSF